MSSSNSKPSKLPAKKSKPHNANHKGKETEKQSFVDYRLLLSNELQSDDDEEYTVPKELFPINKSMKAEQNIEDEDNEEEDFIYDNPITQNEISDLQLDSFFAAYTDDEQDDPDYAPAPNEQHSTDSDDFKDEVISQSEVLLLLEGFKKQDVSYLFSEDALIQLRDQIRLHHQLLLQTYSLSFIDQYDSDVNDSLPLIALPKQKQHVSSLCLPNNQFIPVLPLFPIINPNFTLNAVSNKPTPNNIKLQEHSSPKHDTIDKAKLKSKRIKNQKEEDRIPPIDSRLVHIRILSLIRSLYNTAREYDCKMKNTWIYTNRYQKPKREKPSASKSFAKKPASFLLQALPEQIQEAAEAFIRTIQTSEIENLKQNLGSIYDKFNILWTNADIKPNFSLGFPYKEKSKLGRSNFTKAEDKLLALGLERCGVGAWKDIRDRLLPNKTIAQLQHRYKNMSAGKAPLEDNPIKEFYLKRKKPLNENEWRKLEAAVQLYGSKLSVWNYIANEYFPCTRDASFLRDQWLLKYNPEKYKKEQANKKKSYKKRKLSDDPERDGNRPEKANVLKKEANEPQTSTQPANLTATTNNNNVAVNSFQKLTQEELMMVSLPSLSSIIGQQDTTSAAQKKITENDTVWEVEDLNDSDQEYTSIPDNIMIINGQKVIWSLEEDRNILTIALKKEGNKDIWSKLIEQKIIVNKDVNMISKRYEWLIRKLQKRL